VTSPPAEGITVLDGGLNNQSTLRLKHFLDRTICSLYVVLSFMIAQYRVVALP